MRLTLLGTGTHIPDPHRAGPAILIEHDLEYYLVDCGRGTTRQLVAARVPPERVTTLLFTHHHFDHTSDYGDFLLSSWVLGRRQPLTVYGPAGTQRLTDALLDLHAWDIHLRCQHEQLDPNGVRVDCHEIELAAGGRLREARSRIPGGADTDSGQTKPTTVLQRPGLRVLAAEVDHGPAKPALAYRFETAERSIVLSGDTRPCDALVELARDCDVLVHEALDRRSMEAFKTLQPRQARTISAQMELHSPAEDVGAIATRANVKTLVLTHISPPYFDAQSVRADASESFHGEVILGEDLLSL